MDPSHSTAAARAESWGALFGISGALLLALAVPSYSKWGWVLFLASNGAWLMFAAAYGYRKLLVQTAVFTLTSVLGIANSFFPGNSVQTSIQSLLQ